MFKPVRREDLDENTRQALDALPKRKVGWPRPWTSLVLLLEKDMAMCFGYQCFLYGALYAVMTSIPATFGPRYNLNELQLGLCFM